MLIVPNTLKFYPLHAVPFYFPSAYFLTAIPITKSLALFCFVYALEMTISLPVGLVGRAWFRFNLSFARNLCHNTCHFSSNDAISRLPIRTSEFSLTTTANYNLQVQQEKQSSPVAYISRKIKKERKKKSSPNKMKPQETRIQPLPAPERIMLQMVKS